MIRFAEPNLVSFSFAACQVDQLLHGKGRSAKGEFDLPSHTSMEDFLGRYCGLMLFVKEIDQIRYQQICAVRPLPSPVMYILPSLTDSLSYTGILHDRQQLASDGDQYSAGSFEKSNQEGIGGGSGI